MLDANQIISLKTDPVNFTNLVFDTFHFQSKENKVYASFINALGKDPDKIRDLDEIPFLPVEFFKQHELVSGSFFPEAVFTSSTTTGNSPSRHPVKDLNLYETSFLEAFRLFYGHPSGYRILALLPSYLERSGSSLVYMMDKLIRDSGQAESGFYLHNLQELAETLHKLESRNQKCLLLGVSFALLDFAEAFPMKLRETIIMETGGMKGQREELTRAELHRILKEAFGVQSIHSEYGMTELLSQAYSQAEGRFHCPPWMKVLIRDPYDPLHLLPPGQTGAINIIDLANQWSCSFLATSDLGRLFPDGSFEVLGRMDQAELRGCNLMVI
jgi:phenylacetate-coenzyme A ligase PaaK-like adenylate-forming protein